MLREVLASWVVFLVALPLCMGVAIASGAPPALGLVSGIVGGLVIGSIAGSPLQVSGPAAGLAVLVLSIVQKYGLNALGVAVLVAGTIQVLASVFQLGSWFRAVSPAVIQGMLAGIGVLIFGSQFHVMFDAVPTGRGWLDLLAIPTTVSQMTSNWGGSSSLAALVGGLTILTLVLWEKFRPNRFKMIPGALLGVMIASAVAGIFKMPIQHVEAPAHLASSLNVPTWASFQWLTNVGFWGASLALGLIASAEALLCATAVDRLHRGKRTHYNKELLAQGIGNLVCGALGALPATGVIVRSKANVEAGATTRWPAVLHGVWLLLLVAALPSVLQLVPLTSLAAILVYIGFKLLSPFSFVARWQENRSEFIAFAITVIAIVATDLLTGIMMGFGYALLKLLYTFTHLSIRVQVQSERIDVDLVGAATFVRLPYFARKFEELPEGKEVHIHFGGLAHIDHACMEQLRQWQESYEHKSGSIVVEWDHLEQRGGPKMVLNHGKRDDASDVSITRTSLMKDIQNSQLW